MLTKEEFIEATSICPIIPAVKNEEWLEACKQSDCEIVYIVYGDICNIADIVNEIKSVGKKAIVHIDLISGLAPKEISVDFISKYTKADGIVSMKPSLIKRANELGLFTIQRFFMIDFIAYRNIIKHAKTTDPDVVDLLPATLPKVIKYILQEIQKPVIASGLILDKDDVISALNSGVLAVSTTNQEIWNA